MRKRGGGEDGGKRDYKGIARSIVSDKTRKSRDHRRHYHNVRATYRMTREASGTQRAPVLTPLTPAVFVPVCPSRVGPLGSPGPKPRNMPARCGTDIPAEGWLSRNSPTSYRYAESQTRNAIFVKVKTQEIQTRLFHSRSSRRDVRGYEGETCKKLGDTSC